MEFQEFIKSRFCRPLVLPEEDCPQDATEWRRLVREDQERQWKNHGGEVATTVEKTDEERRVEALLKNLPVSSRSESQTVSGEVVQVGSGEVRERVDTPTFSDGDSRGRQKFNKVAYQREYMRKRRAKVKEKT